MDAIEIDVTYRCDLGCLNCDRSCGQAPADDDMSVSQIRKFLEESVQKNITWRRIRIMGGEPLLHPEIELILTLFDSYGKEHPQTEIELYTNGLSKNRTIPVPSGIKIHSTKKTGKINSLFEPYNLAPSDLSITDDFGNGCWITSDCGLGLNKYGYYPCATGAAIDRVFGFDIGLKEFPMSEEKCSEMKSILCAYCGHYLCGGNYTTPDSRVSLNMLEPMTKSWVSAYAEYNRKKPELMEGGRL
ncbi:MAG: hypothetical protein LBU81_02270 [Methanosarcinales archaeon]|nr:hypothetical protein [Methanosarcinales archaeon]